MPDVRRCAIYGCKSNSRDHKDLKFFNFPPRSNPLYEIWVSICEESADSIRSQRRPYICSKHFHEKDVGFRRLAIGAVPANYLTAPPGFAEEESARLAELAAAQAEKVRIITLMNDVVLEWVKRAQHYPEPNAICTTRRELRRVATEVRNLLGATLLLTIDDYWLRKFRQTHLYRLELSDRSLSRNKSLDLASIINDIDPNARLMSEEEIEGLVKQEQENMQQLEIKRSIARAKKLDLEQTETKCVKNYIKLKKMEREDSLDDFLYETVDSTKHSSYLYSNDDSYAEMQSQGEVSIDLSQDDESLEKIDVHDVKQEISIESYKEALEHLRPLEDFALRQENYRVIGLLSTLESIFQKHDLTNQDS